MSGVGPPRHDQASSRTRNPGSAPPPRRPSESREDFSKLSSAELSGSTPTTATNSTRTTTPHTPFTRTPSTPASAPAQDPRFRVPPSRSATMTSEESSKAIKVAIPRLKRAHESGDITTKPGGRHRVTHACEPCRHRKTKCSGERPTCRHCQDFKIQCYYADGKRDRVKKQFGSMAEKVADYERILRDLQTRVSEDDASLIRNSLDRAAMLDVDDVQNEAGTVPPLEADVASEASGAESEVSGRAGSTGALDKTDEDFTRDGARATGFMGKNSDITWLQRLRHENKQSDSSAHNPAEQRQRQRGSHGSSRHHVSGDKGTDSVSAEADTSTPVQESSYHLNDLSISTFEAVDPFEMPTQDHARILFATYMNRVQPSFPLVGRINLQNQFTKYLARPMNRPPQKWLAIINMIFAIAAKLSHLVQADWRADERDHLIFFTRARLLAVDAETIFHHPDLQGIQILGLMAFYLLSVEQVNRAWTLTGLAIRHATGLGLNMRNESPDLANSLKEIRYRVWWSLYTLEHRLCTMTGRIGCVLDEHCTAPLPVPVLEEDFDTEAGQKLLSSEHQRQVRAPSLNSPPPSTGESAAIANSASKDEKHASRSPSTAHSQQNELEWAKDVAPNSGLYFLHFVQLCRITQSTFQQIYNPSAVTRKWSDLQSSIQGLNQRLETWYRALPAALDFGRKQRDRDLYEARLTLGFHYYSAKQIVNRPCLCRLDQKIPGQSNKSHEMNHAAAQACVTAAREQLALIPDEPNGAGLLRVGPWVTIVHLLVQSATVLMLELSFRGHHMPDQVDQVLESAKKAIRWLHALGEDNLAAARAWQLCSSMLVDSAKKIGRTADDMPRQRPKSYDSPDSDMYMSGHAGMYDTGGMPPQSYGHNPDYAQQQMMRPMTMADLESFSNFSTFDQQMQYDPYLATTAAETEGIQNAQDLRYMNVFGNQHQPGNDPAGSSGNQGRGPHMSGFG